MNDTDHSLYFDLMSSNELKVTVEIRPTPTRSHDSWIYEITPHKSPDGSYRGTVTWKGYDELSLVLAVLEDYYQSYWEPPPQPTNPTPQSYSDSEKTPDHGHPLPHLHPPTSPTTDQDK